MRVEEHYSLKNHNTFGIDIKCDRFIAVEHPDEVAELIGEGVFLNPFFILGGGSNVLFTKDYHGTVIHPVFKGIETLEESEKAVLLRVAAGEEWDALQQFCLQHLLYGLENLTGIPGNVGSAPVQNIGAYGTEVRDCIDHVEGWRVDTGEVFRFSNEQCRFGYRDSIFKNEMKGKCLITHVTFKLSRIEHYNLKYKALSDALENAQLQPSLKNVTDCILMVRNSKLPDITKIGCAGSFFKNPVIPFSDFEILRRNIPDLVSYPAPNGQVKLAAGQLIEKAGWKGRRLGNAGVYDKQALVIVNYGDASPQEVIAVCEAVVRDVHEKFHVTLCPEVNIL